MSDEVIVNYTHNHQLWLKQYSQFRGMNTRDGTRKARSMRIDIRKQTQRIVSAGCYYINNTEINFPNSKISTELLKINSNIDKRKSGKISNKIKTSKFDSSSVTVLNRVNIIDLALNIHQKDVQRKDGEAQCIISGYIRIIDTIKNVQPELILMIALFYETKSAESVGIIVVRSQSENDGKREADGTLEGSLFRRSDISDKHVCSQWRQINNHCIGLVVNCHIFRYSEKKGYKLIENTNDICTVCVVGIESSGYKSLNSQYKQKRQLCKNRLINAIQIMIDRNIKTIIMQDYGSSVRDKNKIQDIVSLFLDMMDIEFTLSNSSSMPHLMLVCKDKTFDAMKSAIQ